MKNILWIFIVLVSIGFASCDLGDDPAIGGTATEAVAGEWWTTFTLGGEDVYGLGYNIITTSNTAANVPTEFLISDNAHTWEYVVKSPLNLDAQTFGGTGLTDLGDTITVNITNGKILENAATSTGGNVTDSIYFDVEFSDDPGTVYQVAGYRRTGFLEDEH